MLHPNTSKLKSSDGSFPFATLSSSVFLSRRFLGGLVDHAQSHALSALVVELSHPMPILCWQPKEECIAHFHVAEEERLCNNLSFATGE
eukprot:58569-Lingulodinium_polyedra.AAC.1